MKKTFLVCVDSEFEDQQIIDLIDNAIAFVVDEAIDDTMFRDAEGKKSYPTFEHKVLGVERLAAYLSIDINQFARFPHSILKDPGYKVLPETYIGDV